MSSNCTQQNGLMFYLNGQRIELENVEPTTLLVDYLRSPEVGLTGTKIGCKQGGCGACTVMLSTWNEQEQKVDHCSINSCMHPVAALDGCLVTTIEGCGSVKDDCISEVQNCLASNNGTQCGYCTPGWVMNMTATVAEKGPKPGTKQEIEALFDGNICRCTGYRPILFAFKKEFASDWNPAVDEKDCMSCMIDPAEAVSKVAPVKVNFPDELKRAPRQIYLEGEGYRWFRPVTETEVLGLMKEFSDRENVRLVGGNTSIGIYPSAVENPHIFIDISQIPSLHEFKVDPDQLYVGASVTYSQMLDLLDQEVKLAQHDNLDSAPGLVALQYMVRRTAGMIVRNAATLAGNTMLVVRHAKQGIPFPSDAYTAYGALGAQVDLMVPDSNEVYTIDLLDLPEFWNNSPDAQSGCLLLGYRIPLTHEFEYAQTYKTALREVNSHTIVNAGFKVQLGSDNCVKDIRVVMGGITPAACRMEAVERALIGRSWDSASLELALAELSREVNFLMREFEARFATLPDEGFSPDYKRHLAESYLYKFFVEVSEWRNLPLASTVRSAALRTPLPDSRGTQSYAVYPDEYPANLPFVKIEAFIQATGEAQYTHDIPLARRGLNGAVVQSTVALGTATYRASPQQAVAWTPKEVLVELQKTYPQVVDYITAIDVPGPVFVGTAADDPLFAVSITPAQSDELGLPKDYDASAPMLLTGFGQCIGLVLAENEQIAQAAAAYLQSNLIQFQAEKPIIDLPVTDFERNKIVYLDKPANATWYSHIWQITRAGTQLDWAATRAPDEVDCTQPTYKQNVIIPTPTWGDVSCTRVNSKQQCGGQIHFYMETQSAYAEPIEDRQIRVHASTQDANAIQSGVATVLKLPLNKVDVRVRRIGGGYGGKCGQSEFASDMAAVAAWQLNRPVRVAGLRSVDTAQFGHRHPVLTNYQIAIGDDSNPLTHGRLFGYQADYWLDGGRTYDCSFVISDCLSLRSDSAYYVPNWNCKTDVCQTNKTTNTAMRTVGMLQAAVSVEDAIEAAAHAVGLDADEVRAKNLYVQGQTTPYGEPLDSCYMQDVWNFTLEKSNFAERKKAVEEFNQQNRWRKRGISAIPVKYGSGFNLAMLEQGGALIEVYDQDGTVMVRTGAIEMGQGLNTKIAQVVALTLNVPMGVIRVAENDTAVIPNPESTGASTGTSFNAGAAQKACNALRARLEEFCLGLLKKNGNTWCVENHVNFWDCAEGWRAPIPNGNGELLWNSIVSKAFQARLNLSAQSRIRIKGGEQPDTGLTFKEVDGQPATEPVDYFTGYTYSAAVTEVEIDVLTGESTIIRSDVVYDAGKSLNPAIDVGQVEGGFVQGLGYLTSEVMVYQPADSTLNPVAGQPAPGALYSVNTWEYKPPAAQSIPLEMNIILFPRELAPNAPKEGDILSAKEIGEPPMTLSVTAFFAIKQAILAARCDAGEHDWFQLEAPATVQRIREACLVDIGEMKI